MIEKYSFAQQPDGDTCCFLYAVYNSVVYFNNAIAKDYSEEIQFIENPFSEEIKEIACCNTGSTINHKNVVEYLNVPLIEVDANLWMNVLINGGVINIMHPICNGHSFFVYPLDENIPLGFVMGVDSWLGPHVCRFSFDDLEKFIGYNLGSIWLLDVEK